MLLHCPPNASKKRPYLEPGSTKRLIDRLCDRLYDRCTRISSLRETVRFETVAFETFGFETVAFDL